MYLKVPKDAGGLGLPNFLWYCWAADIVKVIHWTYTYENKQGPDWVHGGNYYPTLYQHSHHYYHTTVVHSSQTRLSKPHLGYGYSLGDSLI